MEPVRIGVVGLGRFGRLHSLTCAGLSEAQLVAMVARRPESFSGIAEQLPGVPRYLSVADALAESPAEAYVVACSTEQHVEVTAQILAAGKTVLLEKPIANGLPDAESLRELVAADSRNLMLGHILLFNSEFQELALQVEKRGTAEYLDCVRHRPASIVRDFPGENPLVSTMVHDFYCAQALTGGADPTSIQGAYHYTADGAIDVAVAQMVWSSGTVGHFVSSFKTPPGMAPRGYDRMEVFGSGWVARIEPNPRPFTVWDDAARWPFPLEIRANGTQASGMLAEELRCFCRVVRGIQSVPVGARYADGLQVQQWIERAHAAAIATTPLPRHS